MKYLYILLVAILCTQCSEVPVTIPDPGSSSGGGSSVQNVLIEEFTGVRCQNCPAGAQQLEELKKIHKDRLVVLSVHGGFFAQPTNAENKLILDNSYGKELIKIFNQPQGYPSAIINRKTFDGNLFIGGNTWAGYVNTELNAAPTVNIELSITKNTSLRSLKVDCIITQIKQPADENFLSIVIAENNIKDAQLTPTGVDINYVHNHVMRKFITSIQGDRLPTFKENESRSFSFTADIPGDWKMADLYGVAIINKPSPSYQVIQVAEAK